MRAPINEYYTDKEYEYTLREMQRMMERQRIIMEATLVKNERSKQQETFDRKAKVLAENTKATISTIKEQLDTAIRGAVRKKLEESIPTQLKKYDHIP